jgi:RNA polymerase sigma factor (sigma-70 family)
MMTESRHLLADYVKNGSEPAFRELVTHYFDLVFSTALRLVEGDSHRAQDVVQTVFMDLARQAARLPKDLALGGWLHRDTCFIAAKMMRGERRRQLRERQAAEMNALNHDDTGFAQLAPILDEAINDLPEEDRTAVLLRFYERRDLRSVGEAMGTSENAAQKRVSRALDQLHGILTRQGVTLSAAALATGLATRAVTAAPAGLASSIAGMVVANAVGTGATPVALFKALSVTKLKLRAVGALVAIVVATPLIVQHQSQIRLREENLLLQRQYEQGANLAEENRRLSNLLAQASSHQNEAQLLELLRLRSEVGRLRQQNQELVMLRQENRQLRVAQAQPAPVVEAARATALYTRVMKVNAETLLSKLPIPATAIDDNSNQEALQQEGLRQFLKDNGVQIEPPATVYLSRTNGTLIARTSLENLDKIGMLLHTLDPGDSTNTDGSVLRSSGPNTK